MLKELLLYIYNFYLTQTLDCKLYPSKANLIKSLLQWEKVDFAKQKTDEVLK